MTTIATHLLVGAHQQRAGALLHNPVETPCQRWRCSARSQRFCGCSSVTRNLSFLFTGPLAGIGLPSLQLALGMLFSVHFAPTIVHD